MPIKLITAPQRSAGAVINCRLFLLVFFSIFLPSFGFSFILPALSRRAAKSNMAAFIDSIGGDLWQSAKDTF